MNKIFKIIWSKTKNSYVVVSEIAKRNGKCSSSLNKKLIAAFLAAGTVFVFSSPALADDSVRYTTNAIPNISGIGTSVGVEIRFDQRNVEGVRSVQISGDSSITGGSMLLYETSSMSNEFVGYKKDSNGNIIKTFTAKYENGDWTKSIKDEASGTTTEGKFKVKEFQETKVNIGDVKKVVVGGPNQQGYFLRNKWKKTGQITGEVTVDEERVERVGDIIGIRRQTESTGLERIDLSINGEEKASFDAAHYFSYSDNGTRTNNYASYSAPGVKAASIYSLATGVDTNVTAVLATVTGSHSNVGGGNASGINSQKPFQGIGATVYGAGNVIGALKTGFAGDGAGNSIIGFANKANTSNGSLVWGIGNDVSSSHGEDFPDSVKTAYTTYKSSPTSSNLTKLQNEVLNALKAEGGNAMVIGTGNQLSNTRSSEAIGNGNVLQYVTNAYVIGSTNKIGYGNSNAPVNNTIILGDKNQILKDKSTPIADNIVIGNQHTVNVSNSIIIGSSKQNNGMTTKVSDSVVIGTDANVTLEEYESVALGNNSKADKLGGYDTAGENDVKIGKLKLSSKDFAGVGDDVAGTVSIGYVPEQKNTRAVTGNVQTRTLTYVGAGEISETSTDAINGSQLYAAIDAMQFDIKAGDNITVATETVNGIKTYTISSSNATAVKPGENVAVQGPTETTGAAGTQTDGGEGVSVDQGTYKTDNYTVNAADSKVTGFKVESGKPTTSGITTTTDYTLTLTSDEQKVVDGKIETETVDRSVTFTVTDTDTQYELSGEKGKTNDNQTTPYTLKLTGTDESESTFEFMDTRNTVEAGDDTIVVESTENEDGSFKYTITSKAKSVSNVEVKAGSDNVIVMSDGDEEKKVYTVDVKTDGEVASGNTGIVTGDTVYKETRVEKDGNYIKKDNTAAENITELDKRLGENTQNITNIYNDVNKLDNRMRKGLAGAAALAALHPMDFNPDDKLQFSAGVGNYRGETAAALGMFYRPDESVMFSLGGTFGNSDNMVNAGITFGLDGTRNRITRSRTAMAHEIVELKDHIARQDEQIAKLTELVNKLVGPEQQIENTVMFPDVPENHWAYQYVEDLQKQGIIEGYPDGLFKGGRSMTRYEFAAMLDRALLNGAKLDAKISKEFAAELSRIYVERISGQDNDRKKVERVRVNNSDSKYPEGKTRDVYGSKIVTEVLKTAEAK